MLEEEFDFIMEVLESELRPYKDSHKVYRSLPAEGRNHSEILAEMRELSSSEEYKWRDGYASGAVYNGDPYHTDFLSEVYAINSQANPLHPDIWPSAIKYEAEIVAMTASLFGGGEDGIPSVCGTVSSGGTESIMLAMRAYRDWARTEKGIAEPQIVVPLSAHAAFEKAAQCFDMELVKVGLNDRWEADVDAIRNAITARTAVIVGSAPSFPHGIIDPIEDLSRLALEAGVGLHVDSCLGGFVLPFAKRLGRSIAPFDFHLPGVTSLSADTHKFGYAAKGTSVILYRDARLRRYQMYTTTTWMGGLYYSPTFAGSRPGALSAECWAAMIAFGESGYLKATKAILEAADQIREGITAIDGLEILGDPLSVIAFTSPEMDIYAIADAMTKRGWSLNGLQDPPAVHLCVTLRHTVDGVVRRFLEDLASSVQEVKRIPGTLGIMTPIYGMAGAVETRGEIQELLLRYADLQFNT
ncbi:MAG: aminotransferase class V-fold PLP-dependent enzyme [Actinobacteria bacterium]|jgi:glutamate/tyrosine decarboxylase-like PLP-dependent enzyme|nr:aminotransferase class V-fold PLP-dependent enzyme [Actinomycetota bacterium]